MVARAYPTGALQNSVRLQEVVGCVGPSDRNSLGIGKWRQAFCSLLFLSDYPTYPTSTSKSENTEVGCPSDRSDTCHGLSLGMSGGAAAGSCDSPPAISRKSAQRAHPQTESLRA